MLYNALAAGFSPHNNSLGSFTALRQLWRYPSQCPSRGWDGRRGDIKRGIGGRMDGCGTDLCRRMSNWPDNYKVFKFHYGVARMSPSQNCCSTIEVGCSHESPRAVRVILCYGNGVTHQWHLCFAECSVSRKTVGDNTPWPTTRMASFKECLKSKLHAHARACTHALFCVLTNTSHKDDMFADWIEIITCMLLAADPHAP